MSYNTTTEDFIEAEIADVEAFRAEFPGTAEEKDCAATQYAKGRAQDLDDLANTLNGYTSQHDRLKAASYGIRKHYKIGRFAL